jgi:hypothetical protein
MDEFGFPVFTEFVELFMLFGRFPSIQGCVRNRMGQYSRSCEYSYLQQHKKNFINECKMLLHIEVRSF